tara:strand:- start:101885 stop:102541 length:657 start_codon:yes stop_codon:yes gene_type:complete
VRFFQTVSLILLIIISCSSVAAETTHDKTNKQVEKNLNWGIAVFGGQYSNDILVHDMLFNYGGWYPASTYGVSGSYAFGMDTGIGRFFNYIAAIPEVGLNVAYIYDQANPKPIYEFDSYFELRWRKFPWDKYLLTSIAIGTGPSYVTRIPSNEARQVSNPNNVRHWLNSVMFEISLGLPKYPNFEIFYRLDHRSGVFGLMTPALIDSTAVTGGFRYRF